MNYCMHCMQPLWETDKECPFCGENLQVEYSPHHIIPGTILNNRYLIGKVIGQGGFGITYIGRDLTLNVKIALKEYYPNSYVNRNNTVSPIVDCNTSADEKIFFEKGKKRFLEEAQILAKFRKEQGIVSVSDFFEDNNTAYIVMEYLEGEDLKEFLKEKGTIPTEQTIQLMMPVMKTLEKIHRHGLIHRDISPDNIRMVEDGLKLMDFGAARVVSSVAKKSLSVMLKPGYAPYEQYFSSGEQGYWTDVYALCATMYKCITGITPEEAPARMANDSLKTPSSLGISINPSLEKALMKGLSVAAKDRYQSMTELMQGLNGIGDAGYEGVTIINPSTELQRLDNVETLTNEEVSKKQIEKQIVKEESSEKQVEESDEKEEKIPTAENVNIEKRRKPKKNERKKSVTVKQGKTSRGIIKKLVITLASLIVFVGVGIVLFFISNHSFEKSKSAEKVTKSPSPTIANKVQVQGELFDYKFVLDDVFYQLPMTYQSFVDKGWKISQDVNKTDLINSFSYVNVKFSKGTSQISVDIINDTDEEKELKDCSIYGIRIYETEVQNFSMVNGITFGESQYKIKNVFGTPKIDQDYIFSYENERGQKIDFFCYLSTGEFYCVYFQCHEMLEDK